MCFVALGQVSGSRCCVGRISTSTYNLLSFIIRCSITDQAGLGFRAAEKVWWWPIRHSKPKCLIFYVVDNSSAACTMAPFTYNYSRTYSTFGITGAFEIASINNLYLIGYVILVSFRWYVHRPTRSIERRRRRRWWRHVNVLNLNNNSIPSAAEASYKRVVTLRGMRKIRCRITKSSHGSH